MFRAQILFTKNTLCELMGIYFYPKAWKVIWKVNVGYIFNLISI